MRFLCIGALLLGCLVIGYSQPPAPAPTKVAEEQKNVAQKETNPARPADPVRPTLSAASGEKNANSKTDTHQNPASMWLSFRNIIRGWDPNWPIAIFTFFLVVIAFLQWWVTLRALRETRRATDAAITSAQAAERALNLDVAMRRLHSIYSIAAKFETEVHAWADKAFQIDREFVDWHNASINRLSPYVNYLEKNHRPTFEKISEAWNLYHGGDMGRPITIGTYLSRPDWKEKDYWIRLLFSIVDALQEP